MMRAVPCLPLPALRELLNFPMPQRSKVSGDGNCTVSEVRMAICYKLWLCYKPLYSKGVINVSCCYYFIV